MIIKKMVLKNFFRYYNRQEIIFSNDTEKNVTVIKGENGAGKTTLLSAFYWGLYGDVEEPLHIDNMLNYMAEAKMNNGSTEEVFVEIEFEDKDQVYTIGRRQRFIKRNNMGIRLGETELNVTYTDTNGNEKKVDYPETFFNNIIPEKLRGFFFFDGERINRLAQIDGKDEIKKAILDILGLTNLEMMDKDLQDVREELAKEIKKYMKVDEISLSDDYTSKLEDKKNFEDLLLKRKYELSKVLENLKEIDNFLVEHNSDNVRINQKERKSLEEDIAKLKKRQQDNKKELIEHTSKNFKNYLIAGRFTKVSELLEEKRKKGELPSDIKIQFVNDLLERKRCICGRHLTKGTNEYETVYELKKIAGRTELDDAYIRLTGLIQSADHQKDSFFAQYNKLLREEVNIADDIDVKSKKLKDISDELQKSPEEKIKEYEELRRKSNDDRDNLNRTIGKIELQLGEIEKDLEKLQQKLKQANLANNQAQEIQKQLSVLEELGQLNSEIRNLFIRSTRENLDKKIKEVFALITRKDYRIPVLTEEFELKITSLIKEDNKAEVLSTGEGQITSLSFIGSLVSYSREKAKSGLLSDFAGGDFPIVMDSPFGNLDEIHTANVAANIGKLASQVIIVVSGKQWRKEVEENIFDQVGKMYQMVDGEFGGTSTGEYTLVKEVNI